MKIVMLIRHAEKPRPSLSIQGVDPLGRTDPQSLSVRGWQRAGALTRLFVDSGPNIPHLAQPRHLFAPSTTAASPSRRGAQTLAPLSELLGITTDTAFDKNDIAGLTRAVRRCPGPVLIAWQHKAIIQLANALLGSDARSPQKWPDDCFDMIWSFGLEQPEQPATHFDQIPQALLGGDRAITKVCT